MTTIDLLPDATAMGPVMLKTATLSRLEHWYTAGVGLEHIAERPGVVELGVDGRTILVLEEAPDLRGPNPADAGLFHTAILYPTHAALAAAVVRMTQLPNIQFAGTGDHHVSEAFYFADPDGNGVELYVDRPREQWHWSNGQIYMTTEFIDPNRFVQEHLDRGTFGQSSTAPVEAKVGHVHLQVGDVATARDFYVDALGFAETTSLGNTALFVSAGETNRMTSMSTTPSSSMPTPRMPTSPTPPISDPEP